MKILPPLLIELKEKTTGLEYIETVVKYILNIGEEISLSELDQKSKNISAEGSAVIMTIAEKIYHDGKEEGKIEGKEEGKIENMQEMIGFALNLKFGLVSKDLEVDINKINDYDKLKEVKRAIKSCDTLEEFKDSLNL